MNKETEELLKQALIAGLREDEFYRMTYAEVVRFVEAYQQREKDRTKQLISLLYDQANLIATCVGASFSKDPVHIPTLHEMYPTLFEETITEEEVMDRKTEQSMANFMQFALQHNNKFKGDTQC